MSEQSYLKLSFAATLTVALFGIVMGLVSGSLAIAFDGVYSLIDAGITFTAYFVSGLILRATAQDSESRRLGARFNMGLWHLEPLLVAIHGMLLMSVAGYALVNGLMGLAAGGTEVEFGVATFYAVLTLAVCLSMAVFGRRRNRSLASDLVAIDTKSWIMSASITGALLVAFLIGMALKRTGQSHLVPFVDPAILALVSLLILPVPLREVRQAIREILLVTPPDLRAEVDRIAGEMVRAQGFLGYHAYVAEVGRARQIELHFLVPAGGPARPLEHWDRLRDEIGAAIGGTERHRWLTVLFTADPEWAE